MKIEKIKVKYFVDIGLLISFLLVVITGIIKFGKLLGFFGINPDYANLPMSRISAIHDWSGIVLAVLVLIHLILNFDWIISTTKCFFEKKKCEVEDENSKI